MIKRTFTVTALWDEEAEIFFSKSDIDGFHIEAETIEEFESLMMKLGPDLIVANHILKPENSGLSLSDMIPTILWQRPKDRVHA